MSIVTQPREIQLLIIRHLNVPDLLRVSKTCHSLKEAVRDPSLWTKLTLTYEKIKTKTEACRNHVSRCSKLREIIIIGQEEDIRIRSDKIMSVVLKAKTSLKLLSINLASHAGLSNSSFEKIGASMTQLTHLDVNGEKLGRGGIAGLSRLKELKTLKLPGLLCGDNFVHDGLNSPMAFLVDLFGNLKKLEEVELQSCAHFPSDEVVESLVKNNPNLHHLDISTSGPVEPWMGMGELTSRSLVLIADKCPELTYIGFANQKTFSSSSITKLVSKCPKLKHVNLQNTNVSDNALAVMSKNCPYLEYLNIFGCFGITQEGLERLVNLASAPNLKQLHVSDWYADSDWEFLVRSKKDLPSLKIVIKKEFDEDDSYDSEDGAYGHYYSSDDSDCSLM